MANTIDTLNKRIAKNRIISINPAMKRQQKIYLALKPGDAIDGALLKSDSDYSGAVCERVAVLTGDSSASDSLCDFVMEGDYSERTTIQQVASEWDEATEPERD